MDNECNWRFVSNNKAVFSGINDAGITTFSVDIIHSLVRECIQNSLDARLDSNKPVVVEFSFFSIDNNDFPDSINFREILQKCYVSQNDPTAGRFFNKAKKTISQPILTLRISDNNTCGLIGAEDANVGTAWSRLIKETGSSNKNQTDGGSFGIGKAAPFACSELRTVFYSSLDKDGIESHIGVSRLISFKYLKNEIEDWTTGIGYYSNNDNLMAISGQANIDPTYVRKEPGTDIYTMGFHIENDLESEIQYAYQDIIFSVLDNFLVSIWKNMLIVKIGNRRIDKNTLGVFVNELNQYSNPQNRAILNYYTLLTSGNSTIQKIELNSEEYGAHYGFQDGECTLYLMTGENLNRRVLMTRNKGMKLFEQGNLSGSIDFTGILMIDGENMNREFRRMEKPSHDKWEPSLYDGCGGKSYASTMYKNLRNYLKKKILEMFDKEKKIEIDAYGANSFLPDTLATNPTTRSPPIQSDHSEGIGKPNNEEGEAFTGPIGEITSKPIIPVTKKSLKNNAGLDSGGDGEVTRNGKKTKDEHKHHDAEGESDEDELTGFKNVDVKMRVVCLNKDAGKYRIKYVVPHDAANAKLVFYINGEQGDYELPIKSANIIHGSSVIKEIHANKTLLKNVKENDVISIDVEVGFNHYCMMEVDYYEN